MYNSVRFSSVKWKFLYGKRSRSMPPFEGENIPVDRTRNSLQCKSVMKDKVTQRHEKADSIILTDDGLFPNNSWLPLLLYRDVLVGEGSRRNGQMVSSLTASEIEELFHRNHWINSWRNGIYSQHHYHSTAHEVLGVYSGSAKVQLGGAQGFTCELGPGDVVVIPAGVAHKCLHRTSHFAVVGAYPVGQMWDMCYGRKGERPGTDRNIERVPDPQSDPVFGAEGPLVDLWLKKSGWCGE